jgi:hydroxypyruvate isomerase
MPISRRQAVQAAAGLGVFSAAAVPAGALGAGRLKQAVCKWCFRNMTVEELAAEAAKMGIAGIDLLNDDEWPLLKKYGLTCSMGQGVCTIPDGLNRKENHSLIEANFRKLLPAAKEAGVPNMICFSGNRRGMSDAEAWDNCALLLKKVAPIAEDLGVTIQMELLNSKVNHADYQCDKTAWGVELCKRVDSPRFKLLYDIYHMQIMEGDVIHTIRDNARYIGHFHTGGNPGRHEIDDTQELNYKAIAEAIADLGYDGYFAHEFIPERDPMTSLRQAVEICNV